MSASPQEIGEVGRILPRGFGGSVDLSAPWFWTSGFKNCEGINVCYCTCPDCGTLFWQLWEMGKWQGRFPHSDGVHLRLDWWRRWICDQGKIVPTTRNTSLAWRKLEHRLLGAGMRVGSLERERGLLYKQGSIWASCQEEARETCKRDCYWHWAQTWWKHLTRRGLAKPYHSMCFQNTAWHGQATSTFL